MVFIWSLFSFKERSKEGSSTSKVSIQEFTDSYRGKNNQGLHTTLPGVLRSEFRVRSDFFHFFLSWCSQFLAQSSPVKFKVKHRYTYNQFPLYGYLRAFSDLWLLQNVPENTLFTLFHCLNWLLFQVQRPIPTQRSRKQGSSTAINARFKTGIECPMADCCLTAEKPPFFQNFIP